MAETNEKYREISLCSDFDELQHWSLNDRRKLLTCLTNKGHEDLDYICDAVSKPREEVIEAIEYYKALAVDCLKRHNNDKNITKLNRFHESFQVPLLRWLRIVLNSTSADQLQTEIPTALRLIMECEHFPNPENVDNVDFKQMYLYLIHSFEGRPLPQLNNQTSTAFYSCLLKLARSCKLTDKGEGEFFQKITHVFHRLNESDKLKSASPEVISLRHLCNQLKYNPLGMPEKYFIGDE